MKTIALYNLKGGVGKTTAAVNLACLAAADGASVLLWDLDPQGAAGWSLGAGRAAGGGIRWLLRRDGDPGRLAVPTRIHGLSVLPSRLSWRKLDAHLDGRTKPRRVLRGILRDLGDAYDWVFLDCPPGISLLAENVFQAADCLLVPVVPSALSVRAWETLAVFLRRGRFAPSKAVPFFSMVERGRRTHGELMRTFRRREPATCLSAIPRRADIESASLRPVALHRPRSPGGRAYIALWGEVRARLADAAVRTDGSPSGSPPASAA